nr:hypothetical protein [Propionicimonas sp.]
MAHVIGFRPTPEDERILAKSVRDGETTSDVLRRALRLLDYDQWLEQAHTDARALHDEDLHTEPESW